MVTAPHTALRAWCASCTGSCVMGQYVGCSREDTNAECPMQSAQCRVPKVSPGMCSHALKHTHLYPQSRHRITSPTLRGTSAPQSPQTYVTPAVCVGALGFIWDTTLCPQWRCLRRLQNKSSCI